MYPSAPASATTETVYWPAEEYACDATSSVVATASDPSPKFQVNVVDPESTRFSTRNVASTPTITFVVTITKSQLNDEMVIFDGNEYETVSLPSVAVTETLYVPGLSY